jgi:hypothetical protein
MHYRKKVRKINVKRITRGMTEEIEENINSILQASP